MKGWRLPIFRGTLLLAGSFFLGFCCPDSLTSKGKRRNLCGEHRPVIALDFPSFEAVKEFLALFPVEESLYLKVGMELYYATGPEIISYLKNLGHSVFLDLKLHDIPNTVKSAMKILSQLGVDMTNVHAAGGVEMMKAAREGLGSQAKLIAVTQLTSTSEAQMQDFQNIPNQPARVCNPLCQEDS